MPNRCTSHIPERYTSGCVPLIYLRVVYIPQEGCVYLRVVYIPGLYLRVYHPGYHHCYTPRVYHPGMPFYVTPKVYHSGMPLCVTPGYTTRVCLPVCLREGIMPGREPPCVSERGNPAGKRASQSPLFPFHCWPAILLPVFNVRKVLPRRPRAGREGGTVRVNVSYCSPVGMRDKYQ